MSPAASYTAIPPRAATAGRSRPIFSYSDADQTIAPDAPASPCRCRINPVRWIRAKSNVLIEEMRHHPPIVSSARRPAVIQSLRCTAVRGEIVVKPGRPQPDLPPRLDPSRQRRRRIARRVTVVQVPQGQLHRCWRSKLRTGNPQHPHRQPTLTTSSLTSSPVAPQIPSPIQSASACHRSAGAAAAAARPADPTANTSKAPVQSTCHIVLYLQIYSSSRHCCTH